MTDSHQSTERTCLRRDGQEWAFDRAFQETGRVFNFQHAGRGRLPQSVKMHAMISKHLARKALRVEHAQHTVFSANSEKQYLHDGVFGCYDEVRRLAPGTIEHVDVPWAGCVVSGYLHLADVPGPAAAEPSSSADAT